jgi:hypothetical protein
MSAVGGGTGSLSGPALAALPSGGGLIVLGTMNDLQAQNDMAMSLAGSPDALIGLTTKAKKKAT